MAAPVLQLPASAGVFTPVDLPLDGCLYGRCSLATEVCSQVSTASQRPWQWAFCRLSQCVMKPGGSDQ